MNMKKIMISALAVLVLTAFSGADYANAEKCTADFIAVDSGGCETGQAGKAPDHKFKGSKNVYAIYFAGGGQDYTIATYHSSGTKTYGSSSFDQKIFTFAAKAEKPPTAKGDGTSDPGFDGKQWTSL